MKASHRNFSVPVAILAATVLVGGHDTAAQTAAAIPPLEPFFTKEWRPSEIEQAREATGGRALR